MNSGVRKKSPNELFALEAFRRSEGPGVIFIFSISLVLSMLSSGSDSVNLSSFSKKKRFIFLII